MMTDFETHPIGTDAELERLRKIVQQMETARDNQPKTKPLKLEDFGANGY